MSQTLVFLSLALAATTAVAQKASTTSSAPATTHTVAVGARTQNGFKFEPDNVKASVGDIIEFNFYPGGHSVVRADYKRPCIPWELSGVNRQPGFFSGFQNPHVYSGDGPKFRVRVNDTDPIFYYCSAPGSCFEQNMVGVINEVGLFFPSGACKDKAANEAMQRENATLKVQKEFAANATFQLNPGEPLPSETSSTKPAQSSSPPASGSDSSSHGSSLSAGAIAGIAIGGAAVLLLAGALLYLCGRRERLDSLMHRRDRNSYAVPPTTTENKYDPRSPGQETFNSHSPYSVRDPYGPGPHSPPMHSHYTGTPPPPMSPGHSPYNTHQGMAPPPPMSGGQPGHGGYYPTQSPPPPPVELAASSDPGNSPLPSYRNERALSWGQGPEVAFRPGAK
ncbi:uncharacterized protein E0L32_003711 [Thyridium curvatum]|uniref:Extracellular serine-rich protein n=1 Tax=Thyridium curvatum TaxID=1093900 RepID=A0A507B993_9PEZI|nr:uncharacterized protein E0L32_003711 [Thyridium curvatum]TPX16417.1 hypothetical protein E0L32_003711 [Thyridium curvatum]